MSLKRKATVVVLGGSVAFLAARVGKKRLTETVQVARLAREFQKAYRFHVLEHVLTYEISEAADQAAFDKICAGWSLFVKTSDIDPEVAGEIWRTSAYAAQGEVPDVK